MLIRSSETKQFILTVLFETVLLAEERARDPKSVERERHQRRCMPNQVPQRSYLLLTGRALQPRRLLVFAADTFGHLESLLLQSPLNFMRCTRA